MFPVIQPNGKWAIWHSGFRRFNEINLDDAGINLELRRLNYGDWAAKALDIAKFVNVDEAFAARLRGALTLNPKDSGLLKALKETGLTEEQQQEVIRGLPVEGSNMTAKKFEIGSKEDW